MHQNRYYVCEGVSAEVGEGVSAESARDGEGVSAEVKILILKAREGVSAGDFVQ
jgi:hypothetical protein